MWSSIKTVVEEHLSPENLLIYLYSAGRWSDDEVALYLLNYHQETYQSQQTKELTKVIQEVVSPEVSKLNHAVMNKK